MNVRIRVILKNSIVEEFTIEGKITKSKTVNDTPIERELMLISGTLFQMEYAINEHVPYLRCHIEAALEPLPQEEPSV